MTIQSKYIAKVSLLFIIIVIEIFISGCGKKEQSIISKQNFNTKEGVKRSPATLNSKPNLVLITIDTLRADHLGCYGYTKAKTPNIDALAHSGTQFEMATTVNNNTLPSHAAMLIGKYPHNFGVPRNGFRVPQKHETIATILKSKGYETAAFISSSALDSSLGLNRGFDLYDENFDTKELDQVQRRANSTSESVVSWLKTPRKKPFFLWAHFFDPHYPYTPPPPYDKMFFPEYQGKADGSIPYICGVAGVKGFPKIKTTPADLRKLIALYDGEIAFLDNQLKEILEILNQQEHRERTVVIFVSDHGESLVEHQYYFDHGEFVFQPSMHIPLIIRPTSQEAVVGRIVKEQVENIDIFATALSLLGIPIPKDSDSYNLKPLLFPKYARWEKQLSYGESCRPWAVEKNFPNQWPNNGKSQFVLDYPWKLIVTPFQNKIALYQLNSDPGEHLNIAKKNRSITERLLYSIKFWRRTGRAVKSSLDLKNIKKLKSLGYIE